MSDVKRWWVERDPCECVEIVLASDYDAANATYLAGWTAINERMLKVEAERDALAATLERVKALRERWVNDSNRSLWSDMVLALDAALTPPKETP